MTRKHTGLDFADMMVEQYGNDALRVALESVHQVHIRLARRTAGLREVKPEDVSEQRQIITACCSHFRLTQKEFFQHRPPHRISRARRVCYALLRDRMKMSLREIGDIFKLDYTTVIRGLKMPDARNDAYRAITAQLSLAPAGEVLELVPGPVLELAAS